MQKLQARLSYESLYSYSMWQVSIMWNRISSISEMLIVVKPRNK